MREFEVKIEKGNISLVNLERKFGLEINISEKYKSMLAKPNLDPETQKYLKEQYLKAQELINNINQRHLNLEKIATYIIEKQKIFVEKGAIFLEPLLQKELARYLGLSNSTISRILNSKYIQTPFGVFALKILCPRDHFGKTKVRLALIIKKIIHQNPEFSDEKIKVELQHIGINIARRTITKYRLESSIESSFKRQL